MSDSNKGLGPPTAHILPTDSYISIFDEEFNKYLLDEDTNPILKLRKEVKELQKQIDEQVALAANYEKTCETIVRHQENFLHKIGALPKANTRNVGVYVNISLDKKPSVEKSNLASNSNLSGSLPTTPVKDKVQLLSTPNKQTPQKRGVVDIVDLTLEEEKANTKVLKTSEGNAVTKQLVTSNMLISKNVGNIPPAIRPAVKIGAPQVQFPNTSSFPTSYVSTTTGIRHAYVLSPKSPFNLQPLPSNKPNETPRFAIGNIRNGGTVFLTTSRPPGHVITGHATIANFSAPIRVRHPLPLPDQPYFTLHANQGKPPPKPILKISNPANGIVLSWNMTMLPLHAAIKTYQIFGYEENVNATDSTIWKRVGEVKAMPLPMACTLTQFTGGRRYHFAIRAMDIHYRAGPFSDVSSISLLASDGTKK